MAIYYIENPNGKYPSEDGSRRFDKLSGKDAYAYLQTEEGKSKRFMKANDAEDDGDIVYVEVRKKDIPAFRVDERREQYVNDCIEQSGIITISLYACENLGDYLRKVLLALLRPLYQDLQTGHSLAYAACL